MKLHVYLRNLGVASRRKSEELIGAGQVMVNGKPAHIGQQVEGTESITISGQQIAVTTTPQKKQYMLINKPVGYTSTTASFFENEHSVLELLPYQLRKSTQWQIVGRLDKNSEGLLFLTDDGELCYVLTHPKFEIEKEYVVTVARSLEAGDIDKLLQGVPSPDGEIYRFDKIEKVSPLNYSCVLTEGKKREIREAISLVGSRVTRLIRVRIGELRLGELASGSYRAPNESEQTWLSSLSKRVPDAITEKI